LVNGLGPGRGSGAPNFGPNEEQTAGNSWVNNREPVVWQDLRAHTGVRRLAHMAKKSKKSKKDKKGKKK
jgi:hypothetical protein